MSRTTKRILVAAAAVLVLLTLLAVAWFRAQSHELPALTESAEADALARDMMASVHHRAWQDTGAVTWVFRDRHLHVWDRSRNLALVSWEAEGPSLMEVVLDLDSRDGIVLRDRLERTAEEHTDERAEALRTAWETWVNDSFWLNPIAKLFDDGTARGLVSAAEGDYDPSLRGLLVTYRTGGVTPGDSYLWLVDAEARPVAWRMWTRILPIQGLETSWEGWQELDTGAVVATRHQTPLGALGLSQVRGARTLADLEVADHERVGELFERLARRVGRAGPPAAPGDEPVDAAEAAAPASP